MVDLSEFESKKKSVCVIAELPIDAEQREKLNAAMADKKYSTYTIRKVLTSWNYPVSATTIDKHRLGHCACYRAANA